MSNMYARMRRDFAQDPDGARQCAQRLIDIRKRQTPLRTRKCDSSLLLATWNLRDFDSNKFGYGPRRTESLYYIAEMLSCFDLIAVQEINRDLTAWEKVMAILCREWDYIATDTTKGAGGNDERMVFVYNTEKIWFRKIAGEIVLPKDELIKAEKASKKSVTIPENATGTGVPLANVFEEVQFARSPFMVAFQSGWFRFSLCTAHLYYGAASGPKLQQRIAEIQALVKFFADRQDKVSKQERDRHGQVENYIILGDFNVVKPDHDTMRALKSNGFVVPDAIDGDKVRKEGNHYYDQIAVRVKDPRFKVLGGGMLQMYEDVFRDEDFALYKDALPKADPEGEGEFNAKTPEAIYKKWRTWQMSDHHPLWIEIATDFSDQYLSDVAAGKLFAG
ncbi:endonuclease/exonuclease/phosphatase family protein [Sphingomonas sp. LB-2]|uniref:endonuclease/exonuclease/phosphatase family protein n=1 Tax=Sphingomonas caeni TaxID=2984949 RepID=UPI002231EF2D|nr:endonuclease/exonuclease/phosphatase family protein [Sphingomonas caeni]MCW3847257.1 endonuclease/exonuclease/phosphatase family protein [Sphingomonas caeni]